MARLDWTFSVLYFIGPESCTFMDLDPSLWTLNGFGPLPIFSLLETQMLYFFPRFQFFALFWTWVQHCDFLDLNMLFWQEEIMLFWWKEIKTKENILMICFIFYLNCLNDKEKLLKLSIYKKKYNFF